MQREAVRQLSFRCPVLLASELRRKAAFNQLEQQQIIVEGIKRVLAELRIPPRDAGLNENVQDRRNYAVPFENIHSILGFETASTFAAGI